MQRYYKTAAVICVVVVVGLCGLLWKVDSALKHAVGIDPSHSSAILSNVTTEDVNDPLTMFERTFDNIKKSNIDSEILMSLQHIRIGNVSALVAMKKTLLELYNFLSKPCASKLLLAVENFAAAVAFAGSCHLDHSANASATAECFSKNADDLLWAMKLFDSWGKPPSGIASSGPFLILGDYDQCFEITVPNTGNFSNTTQYCRADIIAPTPWGSIPLTYGLCVPSTCFPSDLGVVLPAWTKNILGEFDTYLRLANNVSTELTCFSKPNAWSKEWTQSEFVFLVVIIGLIIIVAIGTVLDLCSQHRRHFLNNLFARQQAGFDFDDSEFVTESSDDYIPVEEFFKFDVSEDVQRIVAGRCDYNNDEEVSVAGAPTVALTYKAGAEVRQTFSQGSFLRDIICAFSIRRSAEHILREPGSQIRCLHSLRVLNAIWVMIGHAFLLSMGLIGNPRKLLANVQKSPLAPWILNASLAVDSFFFMAGAVLAFSLRRRLLSVKSDSSRQHRTFGISRWLILYFHRGLRLLPAYAFVLGFTVTFFNKFGSGPMWDNQNGVFGSKCTSDDWWHHLLFIANFNPSECMPWMWYLALDSQFYLVAPVCLFLLYKVPAFGKLFIVGLITTSSVYRFVIFILHKFPANLVLQMVQNESLMTPQATSMFALLYATPQARFAPFGIGLLLGWILAVKKRVPMPHVARHDICQLWPVRLILFLCVLSLLGWAVHGGSFGPTGGYYETVYGSQARLAWSLGLALLVWLCERGHLEPLGAILRWSHWIPVSRLCFGVYLSHELLLIAFVYQRRHAWIVESPSEMLLFAAGIGVFAVICAVLLAIFVEIPPLLLERKLFMRLRRNISFRKHADGALSISEAAISEQSLYFVKRQRRLSRESQSTRHDFDVDRNLLHQTPVPPALPNTDPEDKVLKWLSQTAVHDNISLRGQDYMDTLSSASTPDATARGLSPLYPWDNADWAVDSREQHFTAIDSTQRSVSQRSVLISVPVDRTQRSPLTPRALSVIFEDTESKDNNALKQYSSYGSADA